MALALAGITKNGHSLAKSLAKICHFPALFASLTLKLRAQCEWDLRAVLTITAYDGKRYTPAPNSQSDALNRRGNKSPPLTEKPFVINWW